ncbi:MAG: Fpg/Nei family DNA glycosylase [Mycobacteriales bacterium]
MPEGHTIHRLAREHHRLLAGRPVVATSPQGRFTDGAGRIDGRVLRRVEPYGKHLFYRFDEGEALHVHLGLYGTFSAGPLPAPVPRGALRLRLTGQDSYVDLRGPTACELLLPAERRAILTRLGPDPLRAGAQPEVVWERIRSSRVPIGALLLDQSVLAGVGNVYRAELLYRHGVAPRRLGRDLAAAEWAALWADLRSLMRAGVRAGRIVTTRPEHRARRRGPASREDSFYVYRRTGLPCRVCGTEVRTEPMAARNLYWCPTCQPA